MTATVLSDNPLYHLPFLPALDRMTPAHAEPAVWALLQEAEGAVTAIGLTNHEPHYNGRISLSVGELSCGGRRERSPVTSNRLEGVMKMNQGLTKLWQLGKTAVDDLVDQLGVTRAEIYGDFKGLKEGYKGRIDDLLDAWAQDETAFELFDGFLKVSEQGWAETVAWLHKRRQAMEMYLSEQVRLTPHLVGGLDGFLRVYLATPADRWIRSPRYRKGVKIGRAVGVVCAFTIFLPVSVGRAAVGLLPGASRMARYLVEKWNAAKAARVGSSTKDAPAGAAG